MHARAFSLRRGDPKRILVTWESGRRNKHVYFDGEEILFDRDGTTISLPDGVKLQIKFNSLGLLQVHRQNRPLAGSADDPVVRIPVAGMTAMFIGVILFFSSFFGLVDPSYYARVSEVSTPVANTLIVVYIVAGIVVLGCGILVMLRIKHALWLAIAIYTIDMLVGLLGVIDSKGSLESVVGFFFHLGAIYLMVRGLEGFETLQAEEAEAILAQQRSTINLGSFPSPSDGV